MGIAPVASHCLADMGSYVLSEAATRVSCSQEKPAGTFFPVRFEISDVFCLLFGFILIIKRVYTDLGRITEIMV